MNPRGRRLLLFKLASNRNSVNAKVPANTIVALNQGAHGVGPNIGNDLSGRSADASLEIVADLWVVRRVGRVILKAKPGTIARIEYLCDSFTNLRTIPVPPPTFPSSTGPLLA